MAQYGYALFPLVSKVGAINFPSLNLYIGTGGDSLGARSLSLCAQSPYRALCLGLGTSDAYDFPIVFDHFAGYHYPDTHINVSSHTHMFGIGLQDYGDGEVGLFPMQFDK